MGELEQRTKQQPKLSPPPIPKPSAGDSVSSPNQIPSTNQHISLPNEILTLICQHLQQDLSLGSLAHLSQCSKSFYDLSTPILYEYIHLTRCESYESLLWGIVGDEPAVGSDLSARELQRRERKLRALGYCQYMTLHCRPNDGNSTVIDPIQAILKPGEQNLFPSLKALQITGTLITQGRPDDPAIFSFAKLISPQHVCIDDINGSFNSGRYCIDQMKEAWSFQNHRLGSITYHGYWGGPLHADTTMHRYFLSDLEPTFENTTTNNTNGIHQSVEGDIVRAVIDALRTRRSGELAPLQQFNLPPTLVDARQIVSDAERDIKHILYNLSGHTDEDVEKGFRRIEFVYEDFEPCIVCHRSFPNLPQKTASSHTKPLPKPSRTSPSSPNTNLRPHSPSTPADESLSLSRPYSRTAPTYIVLFQGLKFIWLYLLSTMFWRRRKPTRRRSQEALMEV